MIADPKGHKPKFGETGSHGEPIDYKIVVYPFDKYHIKIKLTPTNEFVEIMEVKINKDFLSHRQRMASKSSFDVDKYYRK
mgnify:CR=1 FL=1